MLKKMILLLLGVGLISTGVLLFRPLVKSQQDIPQPYTLRWRAQRALANGETEISQVLNPSRSGVTDVAEAISLYSLVVAQPVASVVVENDGTVATWHKFRIIEALTSRPLCTECGPLPDPPAELGVIASDQLAVPKLSGTMVVDGVTITTEEADFPELLQSQCYLLFVAVAPGKRVASMAIGPVGVYILDPNNVFVPVTQNPNHIAGGLATSYGNSLEQLKSALGIAPTLTPTPTPSNCNPLPILVQRCLDNGGS